MNHDFYIYTQNETEYDIPIDDLVASVRFVLAQEAIAAPAALSLIFAQDEQVQILNRDFRDIDAPTDILSFPADPLPPKQQDETGNYLGDIILGVPYIIRRAVEEARDLAEEYQLLVVHGSLHLLGYDHDNEAHQKAMWHRQDSYLRALGFEIHVPDYIHED